MAFARIFIFVIILIIGAMWLFLVPCKGRGRIVGTIIILAVMIGYCLIMASRFESHSLDCVTTDKEIIMREMPSLELSEEEITLYNGVFETDLVARYMDEGKQEITEDEIRELLNDVISSKAVNINATLYDNYKADSTKGDILLSINYIVDGLEVHIACYGGKEESVTKVIAKTSGKQIYENVDNEHFKKYIRRRNWFDWMQY